MKARLPIRMILAAAAIQPSLAAGEAGGQPPPSVTKHQASGYVLAWPGILGRTCPSQHGLAALDLSRIHPPGCRGRPRPLGQQPHRSSLLLEAAPHRSPRPGRSRARGFRRRRDVQRRRTRGRPGSTGPGHGRRRHHRRRGGHLRPAGPGYCTADGRNAGAQSARMASFPGNATGRMPDISFPPSSCSCWPAPPGRKSGPPAANAARSRSRASAPEA